MRRSELPPSNIRGRLLAAAFAFLLWGGWAAPGVFKATDALSDMAWLTGRAALQGDSIEQYSLD